MANGLWHRWANGLGFRRDPPPPVKQLTAADYAFRPDPDNDEDAISFRATYAADEVGYVHCLIENRRMKIGDLQVHEDSNWRTRESILALPGTATYCRATPPITWEARGRGIGSTLLQMALDQAAAVHVVEVWVCVVRKDHAERPWLADFYRRRGFACIPPDADCAECDAVLKISLRLPSNP